MRDLQVNNTLTLVCLRWYTHRRPKILFWVSENIDLELARSVRKTEGANEQKEKKHTSFYEEKKEIFDWSVPTRECGSECG